MKENHERLAYEHRHAKNIVITYVQAFLAPFESADSEEVRFYFPLIPIVQESPHADLNALFLKIFLIQIYSVLLSFRLFETPQFRLWYFIFV